MHQRFHTSPVPVPGRNPRGGTTGMKTRRKPLLRMPQLANSGVSHSLWSCSEPALSGAEFVLHVFPLL